MVEVLEFAVAVAEVAVDAMAADGERRPRKSSIPHSQSRPQYFCRTSVAINPANFRGPPQVVEANSYRNST